MCLMLFFLSVVEPSHSHTPFTVIRLLLFHSKKVPLLLLKTCLRDVILRKHGGVQGPLHPVELL